MLSVTNSGHLEITDLRNQSRNKVGKNVNVFRLTGAVIVVNEHKFLITGADLLVYRYMEANPEKFNPEIVENIRNYLMKEGLLKEDIATVAKSLINPEEFPTNKV